MARTPLLRRIERLYRHVASKDVSRRCFLKGIGAAAVAGSGLAASKPRIVIVGAGIPRSSRTARYKTVTADHVILTVPFSVLRKLDCSRAGFKAVKTTAIEQLGYGANSKLHLQFSDRLGMRRVLGASARGPRFPIRAFRMRGSRRGAKPGRRGFW